MATDTTVTRKDIALGSVVALIALGYLVSTAQIQGFGGGSADTGSKMFPYLIGGSMLAVSVLYTLTRIRGLRKRPAQDARPEPVRVPDTGSGAGGPSADEVPEREPSSDVPEPAAAGDLPTGWRRFRHVLMLVAAVSYVVLMTVLGFLPATALFVAAGLFLASDPGTYRGARLLVPVAFGAGSAVLLYMFFEGALSVVLPPGVLGIGGW